MTSTNLPAITTGDDGFVPLPPTDQIIVGTRLKFTDGKWTADGVAVPEGTRLLAFATDMILQRWIGDQAETIRDKPLPDPDQLNSKIPRSEWEIGLSGEFRPPWAVAYVTYLLSETSAEKFTHVNITVGTRLAVLALRDRVASMRMLRGTDVIAEVELASRPMKTRFGTKFRPHFEIVGWRQVGGSESPRLTQMKEPTAAEEMSDEIPF